MRRLSVRSVLLLLYSSFSFSQQNEDASLLLKKVNEELYSNPEQTLKISEHLLSNAGSPLEMAQTYLLLSKGNLITGNYTAAVKNIQAALDIETTKSDEATRLDILLLACEIYGFLDLSEIARPYFDEAGKLVIGGPLLEQKRTAYKLYCTNTQPKP